jgi:hypothetical protein
VVARENWHALPAKSTESHTHTPVAGTGSPFELHVVAREKEQEAPTQPPATSHVHSPVADGTPCVEHVSARVYWHREPAESTVSHVHSPLAFGVPRPAHVSARVYWHVAPAVSVTHEHAPEPPRPSTHDPPFRHVGHSEHAAPKKPGSHASHAAPSHPMSHVHAPVASGSPCPLHVIGREKAHDAPTKPPSHVHAPVGVGSPLPEHVDARVYSHCAPAMLMLSHTHVPSFCGVPREAHVVARVNWHTLPAVSIAQAHSPLPPIPSLHVPAFWHAGHCAHEAP